jgi:hypothetical protein
VTADQFLLLLRQLPPGGRLRLDLTRRGQPMSIEYSRP